MRQPYLDGCMALGESLFELLAVALGGGMVAVFFHIPITA